MPTPLEFRQRRTTKDQPARQVIPHPADTEPGWSGAIRALYDGVTQEPLPAEFVELLAELAKKSVK